jgi:hypothetical protein
MLPSRQSSAIALSNLTHPCPSSLRPQIGSHTSSGDFKSLLPLKRVRRSSRGFEVGVPTSTRLEVDFAPPRDPLQETHSAHTATQIEQHCNQQDAHSHEWVHACRSLLNGRGAPVWLSDFIRSTSRRVSAPFCVELPSRLPLSTSLQDDVRDHRLLHLVLSTPPVAMPQPYRHHASSITGRRSYFMIGDPPLRDRHHWGRESHQAYAAGWEDALRSVESGSLEVDGQECESVRWIPCSRFWTCRC